MRNKWMLSIAVALMAAALPSMAYGAASNQEVFPDGRETVGIESVSIPFEQGNADESNMSIKNAVVIGEKRYLLLPTYDNKQTAVESIKNQAKETLELLKAEFKLADFGDATWKEYRDAQMAMFEREDCPQWYKEDNESYMKLKCFFDIYENDDDNDLMLDIAKEIDTSESAVMRSAASGSSKALSQLQAMLPDQDVLLDALPPVPFQKVGINSIQPAVASFNVAAAIDYAKKYVYEPNTKIWGYLDGKDCTNFVSQILVAGGKHQSYTGKENSGWWHNTVSGKHRYSLSWQRADSFVKYMGTGGNKTKNHVAFASSVKRGNVIALDYHSDGKWDHVGFVTNKSTQKTNGSYTYKVIQHSRNYHAWTTNNINGWASAGSKYNSTYAIVNY